MEWEGKLGRSTRTCAATGVALEPGAVVFSAITWDAGAFQRQDFSEAGWKSQPAKPLGWWRHVLPAADTKPGLKLDAGALEQIENGLADSDERPARCLRFVIALALVRLKAWRLEGFAGRDLRCLRRSDQRRLTVPDPGMTPEDEAAVVTRLQELVAIG